MLGVASDRQACARPARFRLEGRTHQLALATHILASVGWFGIAVVVLFTTATAALTDDDALAQALYRTIETAPWLSIPFGLTAMASGGLLGVGTSAGLIRHWWVIAKISIATAVIVTDALIIAELANEAANGNAVPARLYVGTIAHVVALAAATYIAVIKPRGRTARGRRLLL
jgi:hypothetical protein